MLVSNIDSNKYKINMGQDTINLVSVICYDTKKSLTCYVIAR